MVVLAAEVGGRWNAETANFVAALSAVLDCNAAGPFTVSLLDRRPASGGAGEVLSVHEVMKDDRFFVTSLQFRAWCHRVWLRDSPHFSPAGPTVENKGGGEARHARVPKSVGHARECGALPKSCRCREILQDMIEVDFAAAS